MDITSDTSWSSAEYPPELQAILGRTSGHPLTEQSAHDAVDGLAEIARDTIGPAEGAGVSVLDINGTRLSVGGTDPRVLEADDLQYTLGEGPCISAWLTSDPVQVTNTATDQRWHRWTAAVRELGVRSCLSVPLLGPKGTLGAMKVYSDTVDAFSTGDRRLLVTLARSAAVLLGHVQASDTPQRISDHAAATIRERDTIGIARGILMERFDLDREAAMTCLMGLATDARTTASFMATVISERQENTTHEPRP